jgi:ankyrin repeat protein
MLKHANKHRLRRKPGRQIWKVSTEFLLFLEFSFVSEINLIFRNFNSTPLHYACAGSYLKCVELLTNSGAEVNEINECIFSEFINMEDSFAGGYGCTPLMLACAFDQDGYVVRELVLNARARSDITDKNGYNTLHYAALQGNRNVFEIVLFTFFCYLLSSALLKLKINSFDIKT